MVLLRGGQGGGGGGGGSNTLDQAYDQGGAGAGRTVDVNSGAITFANAAGTNSILQLEQGVSGQAALHVIHATGASPGASTGTAISIDATQRDLAAPIFELTAGNAATTNPVFNITGRAVTVVNEAKVELVALALGPKLIAPLLPNYPSQHTLFSLMAQQDI